MKFLYDLIVIIHANFACTEPLVEATRCGKCTKYSLYPPDRSYSITIFSLAFRLVDLLVRGCNPSSADGEGLGPLHYACEFNRVQSIEELRRYGGSALLVNARCKYGWTPLYTSIHHGSYEATLLLLDIGADVNICTLLGKVCYFILGMYDHF